jgi:hypothetical protein
VSQAELVPFHRLVKLVERELELAEAGQTAELREAVAETGAFMQTLPDPAPESARTLIERARGIRGRVTIDAERLREGIGAARATHRRRKTVARTYAPQRAGNRYSTSA